MARCLCAVRCAVALTFLFVVPSCKKPGEKLVEAVAAGNFDDVSAALDEGADVNAEVEGAPLLLTVLKKADPATGAPLVEKLIKGGAKVDGVSAEKESALELAVNRWPQATLAALVDGGADVNGWTSGEDTPLILALNAKDVEKTKYLLEKGANPRLLGKSREPPLRVAMSSSKKELADLLLEAGVDAAFNWKGETSLMLAARLDGFAPIVTLALEDGVDPFVQNGEGKNALAMAKEAGQTESAKLIKKAMRRLNDFPVFYPIPGSPSPAVATKILEDYGDLCGLEPYLEECESVDTCDGLECYLVEDDSDSPDGQASGEGTWEVRGDALVLEAQMESLRYGAESEFYTSEVRIGPIQTSTNDILIHPHGVVECNNPDGGKTKVCGEVMGVQFVPADDERSGLHEIKRRIKSWDSLESMDELFEAVFIEGRDTSARPNVISFTKGNKPVARQFAKLLKPIVGPLKLEKMDDKGPYEIVVAVGPAVGGGSAKAPSKTNKGADATAVPTKTRVNLKDGKCTTDGDACANEALEGLKKTLEAAGYEVALDGKAKSPREGLEVWAEKPKAVASMELISGTIKPWLAKESLQPKIKSDEWKWGGDFDVLVVVGDLGK